MRGSIQSIGLVVFTLALVATVVSSVNQHSPEKAFAELSLSSEHALPLMTAPLTARLPRAEGGSDSQISLQDNTLVAYAGPQGTAADSYQIDGFDQITTYVVREGDTLGHIAELFAISTNTIRWQNDLTAKAVISPGQVLYILPVDGVEHIIEKGDTLAKIAKTYQGSVDEIERFNNIAGDNELKIGMKVVIPGGEPIPVAAPVRTIAKTTTKSKPSTSKNTAATSGSYWTDPMAGKGVLTQSYHGNFRGIDIGAATGTPIVAAASGKVVIAASGGWSGGYGNYIVIQHDNGAKTLYAHMSRLGTSLGSYVAQGEVIGYVGSTGRSTGPHLHFEIRGWGDVPCLAFGRGACR